MKSKYFAVLVTLKLLTATTQAQSYAIDWFSVEAGGAGASESFALNATVGPPDAGATMSGGSFALEGGYWSLTLVPTPDAPSLQVTLTPTNTAVISWPSASSTFVLQQNSNLSGSNWTATAQAPNDDGTNRFIIVNPQPGNRFYRLFQP